MFACICVRFLSACLLLFDYCLFVCSLLVVKDLLVNGLCVGYLVPALWLCLVLVCVFRACCLVCLLSVSLLVALLLCGSCVV